MKEKKNQLGLRLEDSVKAKLIEQADKEERSLNALMVRILKQYVKDLED